MGAVVGIDLGTTHTVVGAVRGGQAASIADEDGHKLIPSVVSFHPNGNVLVGRAAKERKLLDAVNTISSIKRLIGRSWDTEEVRMARTRFPFEMREGPGQAPLVVARGETYTLPEISAFVLRKAKAVAEAALGGSVDRAVITVPANFNDLQRAATKVAGRVAGLEVLRILNEPTAAALAYGYGKSSAERLAVYDFGGGTLDITLLDLSDNVFEVLATAGHTFLGGDDIDLTIAERMAQAFLAQHRYDPRDDPTAFERLRSAAEALKQRLSFETDAGIDLNDLAHGPRGVALSSRFQMTRAELERLITPIVDRSFDVCREALGMARCQASDFDQVLLVGGSTRIPLVRQRVEEFFGRPVLGHISPDEAVAIGAAIQASALTGGERRRAVVPQAPNPAARQSQVRDTAGFGPSTHPFGRERVPTHPNVPAGSRGRTGDPVMPVLSPAGGAAPRERRPTGSGLGTGTLPGAAPAARPGAARNPSVPQAPAGVDARTLRSAEEQAEAAARSILGAPVADVTQLNAQQISQRYGNLPLILPATAPAGRRSTDDEPTAPGADPHARARRPRTGTVVLDEAPAARREDSVAAFRLDDADLEEVPTAEGYDRPDAPALDEITRRVRTGVKIEDLEDALPIPDIPLDDDELTAVGPAGQAGASGSPWQARELAAAQRPSSGLSGATIGAVTFASALDEPWTAPMPTASAAVPAPALAALPRVAAPAAFVPAPPLLVDVTPLTLAVETVSGYCDSVIERNTPVPCERTRAFVTAGDNQTSVKVRISQGESSRFTDNTLLGEVELTGLRPARRGQVQIAVSFALDTDGILNVSATDVETGRAAATRLRLIGMPDAAEIERMAARQAGLPM